MARKSKKAQSKAKKGKISKVKQMLGGMKFGKPMTMGKNTTAKAAKKVTTTNKKAAPKRAYKRTK